MWLRKCVVLLLCGLGATSLAVHGGSWLKNYWRTYQEGRLLARPIEENAAFGRGELPAWTSEETVVAFVKTLSNERGLACQEDWLPRGTQKVSFRNSPGSGPTSVVKRLTVGDCTVYLARESRTNYYDNLHIKVVSPDAEWDETFLLLDNFGFVGDTWLGKKDLAKLGDDLRVAIHLAQPVSPAVAAN